MKTTHELGQYFTRDDGLKNKVLDLVMNNPDGKMSGWNNVICLF
jgi:hypothetical protein